MLKRLISSFSVLSVFLVFTTACNPANITSTSTKNESTDTGSPTDRIMKDITYLANKDDARLAGTEGEFRTADYISKRFRELGLEVEVQKFPFIDQTKDLGTSLKVENKESKQNLVILLQALPMKELQHPS
ncbi:hypothetical protein SAMN04487866_11010 [Thermoactinomyces sp. DSM 45891]|uniref:hypothetical protein n=1 Tax=Thermoactinomyces sp. DSM 45891 TaxID=1761907 RepID=UPI000914393E|nr:hypothetical protein [Thermoactinomyces sp. DSM 45891]SFX51043.1 hypothetical protein SAMN04487866_11010 [Thermoactinomyces sp. DSM 45891]